MFYGEKSYKNAYVGNDGKLYIHYCLYSNVYPPSPIKYFKEVYIANGNKIILEKTIEAKVTPAQEEKVEWPE